VTAEPLTTETWPAPGDRTAAPHAVAPAPGAGHAVVLGAGIAGLLAARVLADSFEHVTILERDTLPGLSAPAAVPGIEDSASGGPDAEIPTDGEVPGARRGVPQAHHLHALMDRGRQIVEELHPGIVAELIAAGAPTSEVLVGGRYYMHGRRVRPTPTGLTGVLASRALLDRVLLRRTAQLPPVRVRTRHAVLGPVIEEGRVTGVRIRAGDSDGAGSTVLPADLVVDASGRGSRVLDWLSDAGEAVPASSAVTVDLGYCSRFYERLPEHLDGDRSIIVAAAPGLVCGGVVGVEGGRWLVTLAGLLGQHPPTDDEGFEEFARGLPVPDVYDLIRSATPLTAPVPYRFRASVRRHFEAVRNPPEGLVVLGDALCSFNPLYAQGMTAAAQQALVLRETLGGGVPGLPRRFYRAVAPVVDVPWDLATSADLRYPQVTGRRSVRGRVAGAYAARAQRRAHHDPVVARTLMRVVNLVDPPSALLRPALAARVLAPDSRGG
jgi:flavin-dependent dehydrogenase